MLIFVKLISIIKIAHSILNFNRDTIPNKQKFILEIYRAVVSIKDVITNMNSLKTCNY